MKAQNYTLSLIRPETLARIAVEMAYDHATKDRETRTTTFETEDMAAAHYEVVNALYAIVGDDEAERLLDKAYELVY